ncbi:MAG: peptide chain release factor 2 [Candidatus Pacebacteria bacterium]|nr:peptide chain release factor 2 [Candidatus Paceibacterota bacterium]
MDNFLEKIKDLKLKIRHLADAFDAENKKKTIQYLEAEMQKPDFWQDKEGAAKISEELANLKEEVSQIEILEKEIKDLEELANLSDETLQEELDKKIESLEIKLKKEERKTFLSGKHDRGNAILSIYSGAGGQDAQDWATMLLRMYQRYCERKGFKSEILSQSFGDAGGPEGRIGTKSATLEIKGSYAYGLLKKETGVHRLVRLSPFSAQSLRHTSFALVEVLPEITTEDEKEIEIKPEDLKIDFYCSSGPGGQYVNKRETAVRITHLPTGIIVTCQSERLQGENRKKAMKMLLSKLYKLREENQKKELSEIKGEKISASWGNQIRSYVLHPYKLVKDLRTDLEVKNPEDVLDGNLDQFIEAEIQLK